MSCHGNRMACCEDGKLYPSGVEERAAADVQRVGSLAHKSCEGRIDLATSRAKTEENYLVFCYWVRCNTPTPRGQGAGGHFGSRLRALDIFRIRGNGTRDLTERPPRSTDGPA